MRSTEPKLNGPYVLKPRVLNFIEDNPGDVDIPDALWEQFKRGTQVTFPPVKKKGRAADYAENRREASRFHMPQEHIVNVIKLIAFVAAAIVLRILLSLN